MADNDPNKSKNRIQNGLNIDSLTHLTPEVSSGLKSFQNLTYTQTQRYQGLVTQLGETDEELNKLLLDPLALSNPAAEKRLDFLIGRKEKIQRQIDIGEGGHKSRTLSQMLRSVEREFEPSTISAQTKQIMASDPNRTFSAALTEVSAIDETTGQRRWTATSVNERQQYLSKQLEELSKRTTRLIPQTIESNLELNQSKTQELNQILGEREGILKEKAKLSAMSDIYKVRGEDDKSVILSRAASLHMAEKFTSGQLSGSREILEAAKALEQAFKNLTEATEDQKEAANKEVEAAQKRFNELAKGGGGGGGNRLGAGLSAISGFSSIAGDLAMTLGINQRLTNVSNIASAADWENLKYSTYEAINAGDVAALMRAQEFEKAETYGTGIKAAAQTAVGARIVGGAADMTAGALEAAGAIKVSPELAVKGAMTAAAGAANIAVSASDFKHGTTSLQAESQARITHIQAVDAINRTTAKQRQQFVDYFKGLGLAARGMGEEGGAFLERTATPEFLTQLREARISPEEMAKMSQMGVQMMGGGFKEGQIIDARLLERRGFGSKEENLQRMAQLYMAGGNNPQESYAKVLETAVSRGFDNAKLVGDLVQNTSRLAESAGGVATGLDLTAPAAALLSAGISKDTPNREAMSLHQASIQGAFRAVETDIGMSYASMAAISRATKILGSGKEAIAEEMMPIESLMALRGLKGEKRREALLQRGLSADLTDEQLQDLLESRQTKLLQGAGLGLTNIRDLQENMRGKKSWKELDEDTKKQLGLISSFLGNKLGQTIVGEDIAKRYFQTGTFIPSEAKSISDAVGKGKDDLRTKADDLLTQSAKQMSTAALTAAEAFGKGTTAANAFANAFKAWEDKQPQIEKQQEAISSNFQGRLDATVTAWDEVAKKLDAVLSKHFKDWPTSNPQAGQTKNNANSKQWPRIHPSVSNLFSGSGKGK